MTRDKSVQGGNIKGQSFLVSSRLTIPRTGKRGRWEACFCSSCLATVMSEKLWFYLHGGDGTPVLYLKRKGLHGHRARLRLSRFSKLSSKSCQQIKDTMTCGRPNLFLPLLIWIARHRAATAFLNHRKDHCCKRHRLHG